MKLRKNSTELKKRKLVNGELEANEKEENVLNHKTAKKKTKKNDEKENEVPQQEEEVKNEFPKPAKKTSQKASNKRYSSLLKNDQKLDLDEEEENYPNQLSDFIKDPKTIKVLKAKGVKYLFPIQEKTFNFLYEGQDLIGRDRTGSGKTIAYTLPLLEKYRSIGLFKNQTYGQKPYIVILLPTRELALQVTKEITTLAQHQSEFRVQTVYGGTEIRQQIFDIRKGVEIIVGCPGRILDLLNRNALNFSDIKAVILDEADEMLKLGFQEDVEKILEQINAQRKKENDLQVLLFSATMPNWVHEISKKYIKPNRQYIDLIKNSEIKTAKTVKHLAIQVAFSQRLGTMADVIQCYGGHHSRTIIFTETKQEANDILLKAHIKQDTQVLHGDIPQKQREITFQGFREGKFQCLIATNVAARGLDIPDVDLIVQLDPPKDFETYIHRSGRTARAGRKGACIIFYTKKQIPLLERIERQCNIKFQRIGAPQPLDIIDSAVEDIIIGLKKVSPKILSHFQKSAEQMIEEVGPIESLSRALAYISGYTQEFKQRSLLCAIEGFITYTVKTDIEFRGLSYIWTYLKKFFPLEVVDSIRGMKPFLNRMGAVFDIPSNNEEEFEKVIQQFKEGKIVYKGFSIEKTTEIPELEEEAPTYYNNNNNNFNRTPYTNQVSRTQLNGQQSYNTGSQNQKKNKELEVFIGSLPYSIQDQEILEFLSNNQIEVDRLDHLKDKSTNQSKGIAFAQCKDNDSLQKILKLDGYKFKGRPLRINMSDNKPNKQK